MNKKKFYNRVSSLLHGTTFLVSDFKNSLLFKNIGTGGSTDIAGFVNGIFKVAIIAGAMIAVIRLVYAGFLYMGTDVFDKKKDAKEAIQNALIGLLLLLTTYIILNQINPDILNLNITQNLQSSGGIVNPQSPSDSSSSAAPAIDPRSFETNMLDQSAAEGFVAPGAFVAP